ncbi:hypothetical protein Tco_0981626 [Tanacetum coccineum]
MGKEEPAQENVNDVNQPDGEAAPKNDWFKQPPRPPTPDQEWSKCQVIDDQPEEPWFNNMLSAAKDPLKFDELMDTPIDFFNFAKNRLKLDKIIKVDLVEPVYNLLKGTCQSNIDLEYNIKPLPLKGHPGHLTVAAEYFFNNDLEYLKSTDSERKYITSITKMKAARLSKHDVYSPLKILSVVSVKVDKHRGYGYLEEIVVRRAVENYTISKKLFHLDGEVIIDLAVALRMFTRSLIIKKRVEDVQLGVENYQKKLNITKPQKDFPGISAKELYTPSFEPPGVKVHDTLHHRLLNFQFSYNKDMPRRKWSDSDKRRSGIMVDLIDKQMRERRILKNLERLVGARELEMDYKLMQRTI